MRAIIEEIRSEPFALDKAVMGERVFAVESGVHVDGLLKDETLYEPFPPELVGQRRTIVIGKHSGRSSIALKLREGGLEARDTAKLLQAVREASQNRNRGLTDAEFFALAAAGGEDGMR